MGVLLFGVAYWLGLRQLGSARQHAEAYGVEWGRVEKVVEESGPVTDEEIPRAPVRLEAPWGGTYLLHVGELPVGRADHFLVILVEGLDAKNIARGVHVVPGSLPRQAEQGYPVAMLKALANHPDWGLGVSVWGNTTPFAVAGDSENPVAAVEGAEGVTPEKDPPEGHAAAVQANARCLPDGRLQVLLTFAVDATAVREAVGL